MGTSRPQLLLLPVTSGLREMIGGSWETRSPVRSMILMAIRVDQRLGLLGGEVVGQGFGFSRHGFVSLGEFPQPRHWAEGCSCKDNGA